MSSRSGRAALSRKMIVAYAEKPVTAVCLALLLAILATPQADAVPSFDGPFTLTQPNGTTFSAQQGGR